MSEKKTSKSAHILTNLAIKGIQEKKGFDICVINLSEIGNAMCDYFVICNGSSDTNVKAIAESVEEEIRKVAGEKPFHIEGLPLAEWVLLDYFDVIVHVFQEDKRAYYNLEDLWADGKIEWIDRDGAPERTATDY